MLISTETGAGQIVSSTEETRFYDDVACLITGVGAAAGETKAFVRPADGNSWIDVSAAHYARPANARTPMGSGLVPYTSLDAARAADRDGRALSWREARDRETDR
jgi:hypothetical protein